jgi:hypothetical protein
MSSRLDLFCFCALRFLLVGGEEGGLQGSRGEKGFQRASVRACVQHSRVPLATYVRHY